MAEENIKAEDALRSFILLIVGMECWHACAGPNLGSTFSLSLGKRVRRAHPLKRAPLNDEFKFYEGEATLVVWCTWRLDGKDEPVASSDQEGTIVKERLQCLVGTRVEHIETEEPGWDLSVSFSGGQRLKVLCDHIPGDPSFNGNWDLEVRGDGLYTGPGYAWEIKKESPETRGASLNDPAGE